MLTYDNDDCNRFVRAMERAGYDVEHYRGRFYWTGPAVRVDHPSEFQDVCRKTRVRVQHDQLGLGLIIYPVRSGQLLGDDDGEDA